MYSLPTQTLVKRVIPKKTLIDQLGANAKMKEHFTQDVVRVEWLAKLVPSTLTVADGTEVHEISVFVVPLKIQDCPNDIFSFIDGLMPRHTIFVLQWEDQVCFHLNYKEWVASTTHSERVFKITKSYRSEWMSNNTIKIPIEGLTMDAIYESLVRFVAGSKIISQSDNLQEDVEKSVKQEALLKEMATLQRKEAIEKQPQKRFALHKQILELKKKL